MAIYLLSNADFVLIKSYYCHYANMRLPKFCSSYCSVQNKNPIHKVNDDGMIPDLFVSVVLYPMLKNLAVECSSASMSDRCGRTCERLCMEESLLREQTGSPLATLPSLTPHPVPRRDTNCVRLGTSSRLAESRLFILLPFSSWK